MRCVTGPRQLMDSDGKLSKPGTGKETCQTRASMVPSNPKKSPARPFGEYRQFIQDHYDGLAGKLTGFTGLVTGHEMLAGRLIRPSAFDVRGCKRILDAGCGNGRYSKFMLRWADPDAFIAGFDLSQRMLKRARRRMHSPRMNHVAADLTKIPFAGGLFDAIVCGYVLEHLPDPRPGLAELARVMQPGRQMLLLVTEDTFTGLHVQPHVALPHLQPPRLEPRLRRMRLALASRSFLFRISRVI